MRQRQDPGQSHTERLERRLKHLPDAMHPYFDGRPPTSLPLSQVKSLVTQCGPLGFEWLVEQLDRDPEDRGRVVYRAWNPAYLRPSPDHGMAPHLVDGALRGTCRRLLALKTGILLVALMESVDEIAPETDLLSGTVWRRLEVLGVTSAPYVPEKAELAAIGYLRTE